MPIQLLKKDMSRFLPAKRDPDSCWLWQGEVDSEGYGVFNCIYPGGSQKFQAHRSAKIVFGNEPVYDDEDVINACGNKLCCNPKHLRTVKTRKSLI
ncbi:hypothetical protein KA005_74425 [bacterium]|nr:hypothetical protein [bacterium]